MSLQIENISKTYGIKGASHLQVLNKISATFEKQKSASICGKSGSGKSTLLNLLGGLDTPSEGKILWEGRDLTALSRREIAHWRNRTVGFVFQAYHLMPDLNALENVLLPAWISRRHSEPRAMNLLKEIGLEKRISHYPSQLSGGEQQRVAIARALINDPELILADEPTGNLDSQTGEEMMKLLLDLTAQKKKAFILVTHDEKVAHTTDQHFELKDGFLQNGTSN